MGSKYELQAARIEQTFAAYQVPSRVWQATVTPSFVRFDVTTALGTRISRATGLDEELAMALGVPAVRVSRDGGVLHVEVPRTGRRIVELRALNDQAARLGSCCALLGVAEDGAPLALKLPSPDVAHVLIAGTTGSGKTELLRSMLASLALRNRPGFVQFVLIDPKGYPLLPFREIAHSCLVATTPDEALAALAWTVAQMERRPRGSLPHLVLAVDELADLLAMCGRPVEEALTRLTQRGREANVHVIAATQRPAAALVGGMMKANFPVRLVGSVVSPEDARVAAGVGGSGAERLMGRGDFLLIAKGQQIRFQAAYVAEAELERMIDAMGRVRMRPQLTSGRDAQVPAEAMGEIGAPVHRCTGSETAYKEIGTTGAPVHQAPTEGFLPRRPSGPTPDEEAELRRRYGILGTLNQVIASAYGAKSPLTLQWVRAAVNGGSADGNG